jgi:hypothetical protein
MKVDSSKTEGAWPEARYHGSFAATVIQLMVQPLFDHFIHIQRSLRLCVQVCMYSIASHWWGRHVLHSAQPFTPRRCRYMYYYYSSVVVVSGVLFL